MNAGDRTTDPRTRARAPRGSVRRCTYHVRRAHHEWLVRTGAARGCTASSLVNEALSLLNGIDEAQETNSKPRTTKKETC